MITTAMITIAIEPMAMSKVKAAISFIIIRLLAITL